MLVKIIWKIIILINMIQITCSKLYFFCKSTVLNSGTKFKKRKWWKRSSYKFSYLNSSVFWLFLNVSPPLNSPLSIILPGACLKTSCIFSIETRGSSLPARLRWNLQSYREEKCAFDHYLVFSLKFACKMTLVMWSH